MAYKPCLSDSNIDRVDHDEVLEYVNKEFSESEQTLKSWKDKIITWYELYQLVQRKKHYQGMASIFVPETLRAVETIATKLYQILFGQPAWFSYEARDTENDADAALALTQLTIYEIDQNNFRARVMDSFRQMIITGLTVRKILWDFQEVDRTVWETQPDGSKQPKKKQETIKDTWTFEPVDLLTFHTSDINIPYNDLQKAKWIGEQYIARKEWLRERTKRGWFSRKMEGELKRVADEFETAPSSITTQNVKSRLSSSGFTEIPDKEKYEIKEMWGLLPCSWVYSKEEMKEEGYDEDDLCQGVVIIANSVAIIKLEKNPFFHGEKPYVACPYVPKEFELPGIGATQIGESLQQELNDTRNAVMDNKTLVLATMWLKSRASGIKNQDLQMRPNGVITTNDMNGLEPLRPPELSSAGIQIEGVIKNDLRESVGASSNLQGIAQAGVDTATESTQINQESMGRLVQTSQLYRELVLKPTLTFAEYLNYQYYDHIKVINAIGPIGVKYEQISPEKIGGGSKFVSIRLALDAMENPSIRRQQFMNFFTLVQQMPPQLIAFHYKSLDKIYGMFFSGHKLSELYPNPSPNPDELYSPEEERDIVLSGKPCKGQQGQDHPSYIEYLTKEYDQLKYGLDDTQLDNFHKLILSHVALAKQDIEQQHMQQVMQDRAAQQDGQPQNSGKSGNIVNRGNTANASPFTQSAAPSVQSLRQGLGG